MTVPLTTTEPVQPGDVVRSNAQGSGYTFGGRELTRSEALSHGLPVATARSLPKPARIPVYATGRLWTRHELEDLFRATWRGNIGLFDVDVFIRSHSLTPVDYEPYPDMPSLPSDENGSTDAIRWQTFERHETGRRTSRTSRELFSIDGVPQFVPSWERPSDNDEYAERMRKNATIESLR